MKIETRIDGPAAVIGDVHGQTDKLKSILRRLADRDDFQDRWIVFIGDFVDRGSDSKGTVDLVLDLFASHPKTTAVAGNHDFAMACALGILDGHAAWRDKWVDRYDSENTFLSYGCEHGDLATLQAAIPASHTDFLQSLPWVIEHPDYVFVHAGLDMNEQYAPQIEQLRQRDVKLEWPEWLCSIELCKHQAPLGCSRSVVTGHVNVSTVKFHHKRICIDTTGGWKGNLSCVLLPEHEVLTSDGIEKGHSSM